jgi:hypothetical protein
MARLGFEARYSGARQYIFESRSRLRDQEYGFEFGSLPAMFLGSGVAELANTGNRHDFRYGSSTDLAAPKFDFRCSPESGLKSDIRPCPFGANSGSCLRSFELAPNIGIQK